MQDAFNQAKKNLLPQQKVTNKNTIAHPTAKCSLRSYCKIGFHRQKNQFIQII